jgi:hypothetical protein
MTPFRGNINGEVLSPSDLNSQLPLVLNNFTLVNMTGGAVVANVYLIKDSRTVCITPVAYSISVNERYTDEIPRVLEIGEQIKLATSGNVSYDFELNNIEP